MTPRRILVLGSGGREHALAARLARDPGGPHEVWIAPGTEAIATRFPCLALDPLDAGAVLAACRAHAADLVVVGPEAPLAAGVSDALAAAGVPVFGPVREAAALESSKWFAKTVLEEAGVPTARARRCTTAEEGRAALDTFGAPWVIKADGLAAGKGVCVTSERAEADAFLEGALAGRSFGASGLAVVVEEFLAGEEASVMAVTDGERFVLLAPARDFKRALDGDRGANTGGMGARAPHAALGAALERAIGERIVAPTLRRMRERGTPYRGVLYAGLMLTREGPMVIEFNARFGDPETEAVLPLTGGDLGAALAGVAKGALDEHALAREPGAAVAVALTDERYPEGVAGGWIAGLDACESREGVTVCFAACRPEAGGHRITGGRAAYVVARGTDHAEAAARARAAVASLGGEGWRHREDVTRDTGASARQLEPAGNGG